MTTITLTSTPGPSKHTGQVTESKGLIVVMDHYYLFESIPVTTMDLFSTATGLVLLKDSIYT